MYQGSEHGRVTEVKLVRYIIPLIVVFLLNLFMSIILLDLYGMTDNVIRGDAQVYILCGPKCAVSPEILKPYQTQTLVVVAYAFLGWLAWTFLTIFDRASALQLFPATFNRLLIRLVVAVVTAIVVRHLFATDATTESVPIVPIAFAIGMFPEKGIKLITEKLQEWTRSKERSEDFSLELIEGISPAMTYRLAEVGVDSSASLAFANPFAIFDASLTPMTQIVEWIGQAQLLLLVKTDRFETLQKAGCRTIFDLIRLSRDPQGRAILRTLANWDLPEGTSPIDLFQQHSEFHRLREVYGAIGNRFDDTPAGA
jgi:hypothetical protein